MVTDEQIKKFVDKVKTLEKGHKLDLSSDEDLSIAIMNLISIEEHLFFTSLLQLSLQHEDPYMLHGISSGRRQLQLGIQPE